MDASSGMGMVGAIVWMVVLFGIMYFLMLRPQKKEQKRLQAMLNDMEVGDSIVTTSGFYGVIIDMTEEDVIVEFGNNKNCRIPMRKQAEHIVSDDCGSAFLIGTFAFFHFNRLKSVGKCVIIITITQLEYFGGNYYGL